MAAPTPPEQPPQQPTADALMTALAVAYIAGTVALLVVYSRIIREGLTGSVDFARILLRARRAAQASVDGLAARTDDLLPRLMLRVQTEAASRAHREHAKATGINPMLAARGTEPIFVIHSQAASAAIHEDLDGRLAEVRANILRSADDLYRTVVAAAADQQVLSRLTPQEAIGEAFNQFVERGITAYYTRDGRRLPIESYAEMAVRTAAMRAYNISYEDRLHSIGVEYFIVPDDNHPCPLCWPWQHRVLSSTGADDVADASIDEARLAGLFHPQCRHVLLPYIPGRTKAPPKPAPWSEEQAAAYEATQRLRALERRVRAQKQARDLAPSPAARAAAVKRVRATEAAIRQHVERTDVIRRRHRETARTPTT